MRRPGTWPSEETRDKSGGGATRAPVRRQTRRTRGSRLLTFSRASECSRCSRAEAAWASFALCLSRRYSSIALASRSSTSVILTCRAQTSPDGWQAGVIFGGMAQASYTPRRAFSCRTVFRDESECTVRAANGTSRKHEGLIPGTFLGVVGMGNDSTVVPCRLHHVGSASPTDGTVCPG